MDRSADSDLAQLGETLRRERLRRRLTITQVATDTKIRPYLLEAIEAGNTAALPAPVFAAGLIRIYARYLDVDPGPLPAGLIAREPPRPVVRPPSASYRVARRSSHLSTLVVPLLIVLLGLGSYLYQQYAAFVSGADVVAERTPPGPIFISTPLPTPPTPNLPTPTLEAAAAEPATPVRVVPAPPAVTPAPTPGLPLDTPVPTPAMGSEATLSHAVTPTHGVHIDALATARVWVQVEGDGKVLFSGILNAGDKRTWTATEKLMVWSGNAGNVSVVFNGKPLGRLGPPGEVVKVTWTATD